MILYKNRGDFGIFVVFIMLHKENMGNMAILLICEKTQIRLINSCICQRKVKPDGVY